MNLPPPLPLGVGLGCECTLAQLEEAHLRAVFNYYGGRVDWTSRALGINEATLYRKRHRLGMLVWKNKK